MSDMLKALGDLALQQREPWRLERIRREAQLTKAKEGAEDEVRGRRQDLYLALSKEGLLTVHEVLTLQYLLFGDQSDVRLLAGFLLEADEAECVKRHNWRVAGLLGEEFIERYGPTLANLELPLFPPTPQFAALNTRLLARGTAGGGRGLFRPTQVEGGYSVAVQRGDNGGSFVDLSEVSMAFANLQTRVAQMEHRHRPTQANVSMAQRLPRACKFCGVQHTGAWKDHKCPALPPRTTQQFPPKNE